MKNKTILFILLLVAGVSIGCNGTISHYLPALVGDRGLLINISIMLENGSGETYINIYPKVGLSAQESIKQAIAYAFKETKKDINKCDVIVKAHLPQEAQGYIEGPSGGAALTIMMIALLEKKELRTDSAITGAISDIGKIETVGGLYEKAQIVKKNNLKYFLTPVQGLYEKIGLYLLSKNSNFTVLEVENIEEAMAFLIDKKNISRKKPVVYVEYLDETLPVYSGAEKFKPLSEEMFDIFNQSTLKINEDIIKEAGLEEYLKETKENNLLLFEKGYYFSSANDAFMNYLDSETLANIEELNINKRMDEIEECLSQTKKTQITDENFEWVAGQEIRKAWAENKLKKVNETEKGTKEEKYFAYHELMYADAWCKIIKMLEKNAPKKGAVFNESILKELSMEYLGRALNTETLDNELKQRLETAQTLHKKGEYLGSIIESVFVSEIGGSRALFEKDRNEGLKEIEKMQKEKRISLWGNVYASHAHFLMWKKEESTAHALFKLAEELDNVHAEIKKEVRTGLLKSEITKAEHRNTAWVGLVFEGIVVGLFIGFLIHYMVIKGK